VKEEKRKEDSVIKKQDVEQSFENFRPLGLIFLLWRAHV
jgi:hypothetical protein